MEGNPWEFEIEDAFMHHPPKGNQTERYEQIREAGKYFAIILARNAPVCKETHNAMRKIREAVMWANAGIACNE